MHSDTSRLFISPFHANSLTLCKATLLSVYKEKCPSVFHSVGVKAAPTSSALSDTSANGYSVLVQGVLLGLNARICEKLSLHVFGYGICKLPTSTVYSIWYYFCLQKCDIWFHANTLIKLKDIQINGFSCERLLIIFSE
jgi:hypothetical protein